MQIEFLLHKYKYFPYEKNLAKKELKSLFGKKLTSTSKGFLLDNYPDFFQKALRTTYFQQAITDDGKIIIPQQALLEASANGGLKELRPGIFEPPILKRQSTRYSAHGLHEYRGKFNPQIVRAIGNYLHLKPGSWILDPFCGSGTTILEAAHFGCNAVGVEINPLGVEISNAKISTLKIKYAQLQTDSQKLEESLIKRTRGLSFNTAFSKSMIENMVGSKWKSNLSNCDYLEKWFTESVLAQLALILIEIENIKNRYSKKIFQVILSNVLREVSLQDPGDLRIRRRKDFYKNIPAVSIFLKNLRLRVETIRKAKRVLKENKGFQQAFLGDIKTDFLSLNKMNFKNKFDAAITSPPYVTALPYIDTQRLSLALLGLIKSDEIRKTEKTLIGNREITNKEREELENEIKNNDFKIPNDCLSLCQKLFSAINGDDGFRRKNVPALSYKYFKEMGMMFENVRNTLKIGAPFVLVVGYNKTKLGNKEFVINTPNLLVSVAQKYNFKLQEIINLETYRRFDIHQNNSIRSEKMIVLRKS